MLITAARCSLSVCALQGIALGGTPTVPNLITTPVVLELDAFDAGDPPFGNRFAFAPSALVEDALEGGLVYVESVVWDFEIDLGVSDAAAELVLWVISQSPGDAFNTFLQRGDPTAGGIIMSTSPAPLPVIGLSRGCRTSRRT